MEIQGFTGPSYPALARTQDQERTVNFYFEQAESRGATQRFALYPFPGISLLGFIEGQPGQGRAHFFQDDREFAIVGVTLFEIDSAGVMTSRGTVAADENPAQIVSNGHAGDQLLITSGTNAYVFDLLTNTLTQVATLDGKASCCAFMDSYFLVLDRATSTLYVSALLDGTSWDLTNFVQPSLSSDGWVTMAVLGTFLYLIGSLTGQVWYDAGNSPFPFAPHPSGKLQYGTCAPWSLAVGDNALYWLDQTTQGKGTVRRCTGFNPEDVSTFALENVFKGFELGDAYGECYSDLGHTFYLLHFSEGDQTWAYDITTQQWTEVGQWSSDQMDFAVTRWRYHAMAFGEHRWLDPFTSVVFRFDYSTSPAQFLPSNASHTLPGSYTPWVGLRRAPALEQEHERIFYSSFELAVEPGQGNPDGPTYTVDLSGGTQQPSTDPQIMMRMSDDGGFTFGTERMRSAGKIGEYGIRVRWNRCGSARRRVFEVRVSDIRAKITNAYIELGQKPRALAAAQALRG